MMRSLSQGTAMTRLSNIWLNNITGTAHRRVDAPVQPDFGYCQHPFVRTEMAFIKGLNQQ
jgi:hypothetical protein